MQDTWLSCLILVMVGVSEVLGSRSTFTIFPAVRRTRSLLNTFPFNQVQYMQEEGGEGGQQGESTLYKNQHRREIILL